MPASLVNAGPSVIIFSGLPGTGKTSLAETLGRSGPAPVFSVAWLLGSLAGFGILERGDRGSIAYALLGSLLEHQLELGQSAIVDGMVGSTAVRERWRELTRRYDAKWRVIECYCSDNALHRQRVEQRQEQIPGWPPVNWGHVEAMAQRYEAWDEPRLRLDVARSLEQNVRCLGAYLEITLWAS